MRQHQQHEDKENGDGFYGNDDDAAKGVGRNGNRERNCRGGGGGDAPFNFL